MRGIKAQIDGVERFLMLEPRSRILDLACGAGRQTIELARRGHRVLGVDGAEEALSEARHAARQERLNVHFLKSDIRQIPYRAEFDAVVNLFDSFGYFPAERDDLRALEAVCKALKPRGRFLIDLLNKERLMRRFSGQDSFDFETGRLDTSSFASRRVYALTEIKSLIERSGLVYRQAWGAFDGSIYGMDSQRMIILAEKPEEKQVVRKPEKGLAMAIRIKGRRR